MIERQEYLKQLISFKDKDLIKELEDHEDYKKYNPKNGWGSYTTFIQILKEIKTEMEKYDLDKIKIEVSW